MAISNLNNLGALPWLGGNPHEFELIKLSTCQDKFALKFKCKVNC